GLDNTANLRTNMLDNRFELAGYAGRTLLAAKDVRGDFLQHAGAAQLKALTGSDSLEAESKFSNERCRLRGDYGILITANSRLRVRLDGDESAWRRRLLLVEFATPPKTRIPDFAREILKEEGPGVLNWAI